MPFSLFLALFMLILAYVYPFFRLARNTTKKLEEIKQLKKGKIVVIRPKPDPLLNHISLFFWPYLSHVLLFLFRNTTNQNMKCMKHVEIG